ncbi:MAG: KEOPS complex subunit Pcc1 [archaeon]
MLKSRIEVHDQKENNDLIYDVLLSDIVSTERVKITLALKDCLRIDIEAQDATSLRAAMNTILRQIKLIDDTVEVCDKYGTGK